MLDVKLLRERSGEVKENLKRRNNGSEKLIDEFLKIDKKWREVLSKINELRNKRNVVSREVGKMKKEGKKAGKELKEMKEVSEKLRRLEDEEIKLKEKSRSLLLNIPNLLHESVPIGKDEEDNIEVRKHGKIPKFEFKAKSHMEILEGLDLIDGERAGKVAGHGFFYMKNDLVLLDRALQQFSLEFLMKKGFILVNPPYMLNREAYEGVTSLEDFKDVLYKVENEDLHLIATAEHPMAAMFKDEVILKEKLPLKFVGASPCFRKEVGSHGKYTKGLFRMHQFNKVEQFIFCLSEDSWKLHEELQKNAEELYKKLGLVYRVVNVCTGDIGIIAAKKYDTEVWMADNVFREVGSNSNCTDYQARRLNIKYREGEGKSPLGFVHTLNNTAIATSRTMIAIIEQFQRKDGSVLIPKVLRVYMGGKKWLGK